ncbi:UNKNOWN [Stylonychia lemnae]|uniref:Transmembrane protein n=1 Tax=Stylonychia lemnae TaxID=5949 RepID=A0A078A418_STYLE|nr:UNKNOWN [Stylonychia lemnae]|eukprot:CDW75509.1 UNKNOWN [Stylonychia lemnae]
MRDLGYHIALNVKNLKFRFSVLNDPRRNKPQTVLLRILTNYFYAVMVVKDFNLYWPENVLTLLEAFSFLSSQNEKYEDGNSYLKRDMEIQCWDQSHTLMVLAVGIPNFIIWVVGFPIYIFIKLYKKRKVLDVRDTISRFGLFYIVVVNIRKIIFIMTGSILSSLNSQMKALLGIIMLTLYGGLFFTDPDIQKNDKYLLLLFLAILFYNLYFYMLWLYRFIEVLLRIHQNKLRQYICFRFLQKKKIDTYDQTLKTNQAQFQLKRMYNRKSIRNAILIQKHMRKLMKQSSLKVTLSDVDADELDEVFKRQGKFLGINSNSQFQKNNTNLDQKSQESQDIINRKISSKNLTQNINRLKPNKPILKKSNETLQNNSYGNTLNLKFVKRNELNIKFSQLDSQSTFRDGQGESSMSINLNNDFDQIYNDNEIGYKKKKYNYKKYSIQAALKYQEKNSCISIQVEEPIRKKLEKPQWICEIEQLDILLDNDNQQQDQSNKHSSFFNYSRLSNFNQEAEQNQNSNDLEISDNKEKFSQNTRDEQLSAEY